MFSERLEFDLRPNRLTSILEKKIREGIEVIDLTLSNPTRAGFDYPYQRISEAFDGKFRLEYSPDPQGLPQARQAVRDYYLLRGHDIPPEDIFITSSTSEAYSFLFRILADPGDRIYIPVPGYPLFDYLLRLEGLGPEFFQVRYSHGWWYDLPRKIDEKRVKGLVFVSPGNPAGNYVRREEWARIAASGGNRRLPVIWDEVFHDFSLQAVEHAADVFEETDTLVFVLNGFSKTAGLPQLKMSWIIMRGPESLKQAARQKLEMISDTYLSVSTAVQAASPGIFSLAPLIRQQIHQRVRGNLGFLAETVKSSPLDLLRPEGGWSAVVRMPRLMEGEDWALKLLENSDLLVHPGEFYSMPEGSYLVLSLLPEGKLFCQGMARILELVSRDA